MIQNPANFMLKPFLITTSLILAALSSDAQDKEISVQFVSFPISEDSERIELLVGEGKSMAVELPTTCLSPVYKVPVMSQWALGVMEVGEQEQMSFKEYGKAPSAGTGTQLILVLKEGAAFADGLKLIPIKYDPREFAGGQFFMMNTTKVDIGIEMGSDRVGLKPNTSGLIKPEASREVNGNQQLFIKVYFRNEDKMKPFYSSTWRLNDKARSLVFFYHDPNSQRIRTHTIRDYLR
jgi:hypothetical protein